MRSSRIYVIDTKPDPTKAKILKIIEPEEVFRKTGYSRPHTIHCGPEGVYVSTLGGAGPDGTEGPPGIFIMDCESFEILGKWEIDRGPQKLHYDFWWNLPRDYMVSSEWALPPQFEKGIVPDDLLGNRYGHQVHFWDLRARRNVQTIDLGANHQMALEVRPAHDPAKEYGFLGVVVDTTNLEGSIWTWWRENGKFHIEKTATIPPEPADKSLLPPLLQGFGAVPPLVTDIDLSLDDRYLYVSCWGTGEERQYDVSDPRKPKLDRSVHVGGIARRTKHPNGKPFQGGPQMVEISRDGKRVYFTNSLYSAAGIRSSIPKALRARWSWPISAQTGKWNWPRISGSSFPKATARIRCGCKAATARPIPSAMPTPDQEHMPPKCAHFGDKHMLQINMVEHVLFDEVIGTCSR